MKNTLIAPSLLSADFMRLSDELEMINKSDADYLHLDIMDGIFVPNITFGWPIIKQINKLCQKPLDVHLMIEKPERYISEFAGAGADILTVHYEASTHLHRTISAIKEAGMKAGVAINPHSPVSLLKDIIGEVDLVLIMSVNPGFGGQKFIKNSLKKIAEVCRIIEANKADVLVEVDGGVSLDNASEIIQSGANMLVAGNAVFKSDSPTKTISQLRNL